MSHKKLTHADIAAALSFRIAMPVKEVIMRKNHFTYPICPRCRISIEREYMSFCDRCGQALDWDSYSDAVIIDYI